MSVVFSLELIRYNIEGANLLVPVVFISILGTVLFYGLFSKPLAVFLGLAYPNPQGLLILGCHRWACNLAKMLQSEGIEVAMIDSNHNQVSKARLAGLTAYQGDVFSESLLEKVSLRDLGYFLSLTENDDINTLSALHMSYIFNRASVFQMATESFSLDNLEHSKEVNKFCARILFQENLTYANFMACLHNGGQVKKTRLTENFTYASFQEYHGKSAIILFVFDRNQRVHVVSVDQKCNPQPRDVLFYLSLPLAKDL